MAETTVTKNNISASSPEVNSKTKNVSSTPSIPKVVQGKFQNILNNYRSYTYNWTLAGLKSDSVKETGKYEDNIRNLTILRSGGKGPESLIAIKESANALVDSFNKNSPGRFDMFLDNVFIENLLSFSNESSVSLPTKMTFDVFEPYSINGFIEALQTTAVAAGYPNYVQASYILKLEFIGYPDNVPVEQSTPVIIPNSSRYFVIKFTNIGVEITERGTMYKCEAIPYHEIGFGQANTLVRPVSMKGSTVKQILENLVDNINQQIVESNKAKKDPAKANKNDKYEIKFLDWDDTNGKFIDGNEGAIAKSNISELSLKDNKIFQFPNIGDDSKMKDQTSVKYTPTTDETKPIVQFAQGQKLHECIAAVIRDSDYVKNILKTIGQQGNPDDNGMVKYFMVRIEVTNQNVFDEETRKPFQNFTFVVSPYKIHYTRIPGFNAEAIDDKKLSKVSIREYNYIYTGQNVDVMDFKLNFNTLFFEAIPYAMGNNEFIGSKNAAGNDNGVQLKQSGVSKETMQKREVPTAPAKTIESGVHGETGPNSGQIQDDPYYIMARTMHDAIVNSKASMLTGEIKILGDPIFLVTGGIGNEDQKAATPTDGSKGKQTSTGEAFHLYGEVLITVNFRNPVDVSLLSDGGLAYFEPKKVPFSGVYRVNSINNEFRNGVFTQVLKIMRIPGQILDRDEPVSKPAAVFYTAPNPDAQVIADVTPAVAAPAARANGLNLLSVFGRGLPGAGNFTAAIGGLGGSVSSLINQVSGAVNGIGTLGASFFGGSIPGGVDQLASGIRLQTAGLVNSLQEKLAVPALVNQLSNTVNSAINQNNPVKEISNSLNIAKDIGDKANDLSSNVTSKVSSLVSNIGSKVRSLQEGSATDPLALAKKFGIDASQISGLTGDLQSKVVAELDSLSKQVPANVDIEKITGLALEFIPKDKLANLPATPITATAPNPPVDPAFFNSLTDPKQIALAFGVSDPAKISGSIIAASAVNDLISSTKELVTNPLKSLPSLNDKTGFSIMSDKLQTAQQQLGVLTNIKGSVESNLKSLAGNTISTSVTEKFGSVTNSPLAKFMTANSNSITGSSGG